ncbi:primosomal protein N' [Candidatus Phytoplasma palmae]|uniref:replication restart helicase PriA n=1 Tax=Candidatus Phytoplasma palmae TaxID=85624 RepID=UPI003990400C
MKKKENIFAEILVDLNSFELNQCFDYKIPSTLCSLVRKGMRVIVPFGIKNTYRLGYILNFKDKSDFKGSFKEVKELIDKEPFLNEEFFLIAKEILKIPFVSKSDVYRTIIPLSFSFTYFRKIIILKEELLDNEVKEYLEKKRYLLSLKDKILNQKTISSLKNKKIIETEIVIKNNYKKKDDFYFYLNPLFEKLNINITPKQKLLIKILKNNSEIKPKKYFYDIKEIYSLSSCNIVKKLILNKIILKKKKDIFYLLHIKPNDNNIKKNNINLDYLEKFVFDQISLEQYHTYLLYYKFDRNKIKIYLKLIEKTLENSKQILILVPEIILIKSLFKKIKEYFPDVNISVLHSSLSLLEQYEQNKLIQSQKISIVIGTRSAIFSPLKNLGIIIIDEEENDSFLEKEKKIQYDCREISNIRALYNNIPLILSSCIPSLESYYNFKLNKYKFLNLNNFEDVNNYYENNNIKLIDMKKELQKGNLDPFSDCLTKNLKKVIKRKEKAILLINVRGFSSFVFCCFCSYVFKCEKCSQSLTFFSEKNILKCNNCNFIKKFYNKCPVCFNFSIKNIRLGIEYIEFFLREKFKKINIQRIDSDSVVSNKQYENILEKFQNNEINILIGTEFMVKNLSFSNVSLLGVIMADVFLNRPNYKSSEKAFQLLTKFYNYSSSNTKIIVQSYNIDNYVLKEFKNLDVFSFLNFSLQKREISNNPPFFFISKIVLLHKEIYKLWKIALKIKYFLELKNSEIKILGPSLSFYKKNSFNRIFLTIKYKKWPIDLNFIIKNNLQQDALIFFDRFSIIF